MGGDTDELAGFRDSGPQEAELNLRANLGENDFLVDLWQMGEQMRLFSETTVGTLLAVTFRQDFNDAVRDLLTCDDPSSAIGRAAHAEARLNWRLLQKIDETLASGKQAEAVMTENDPQKGDNHD